jgi:hypothetical protein
MFRKRSVFVYFFGISIVLLLSCSALINTKEKAQESYSLVNSKSDSEGMKLDTTASAIQAMEYYVAVEGNDKNPGSKDKPFATLEGARDAIRSQIKKDGLPRGGITIYLRGGTYVRIKSFKLDKTDSGTETSPIVYRNYEDEKVNIIGGKYLDISKFKSVTDPGIQSRIIDNEAKAKIVQYDLKANNLIYDVSGLNITKSPELFVREEPMTPARWPNSGYVLTGKVIENGSSANNYDKFKFQYNDPRPELWSKAKNVQMFGYWYYNWSDQIVKIDKIDTVNKTISSLQRTLYGVGENQRYYVFNLLEELDKPGEYYLDNESGMLYFYPPAILNKSDIILSQLTEPMITFKDTSNLTIQGVTFGESRGSGAVINNGHNIKICSCTFKNMSEYGVSINGGNNNGVKSCSIYNMGAGGIFINGGDRKELIPSGSYAENNNIYNYSRIIATYTPGIRLDGVGNRASNNLIHDAPHCAIIFYGNDNIIEYNEIYRVALETDDVGAIYSGRDWTYRGNIIRFNFLHDIDNPLGSTGISGVYLDDCISGVEVYGNIFYRDWQAIAVGGGRDHVIKNNMIIDCKNSLYFDERGLTWDLSSLYDSLSKVPYTNKTWKAKYPELFTILEGNKPGVPLNNTIENNMLYNTPNPHIFPSVTQFGKVENNKLIEQDPQFQNINKLDLSLKDTSIVYKEIQGFEKIPFSKIGLIGK